MFNLTDRKGRKVPFLKWAVPSWIASIFPFAMIAHTAYLEMNRPEAPDPQQGFVVAQTVNRTTRYLTQADQLLNGALWIMAFVAVAGAFFYLWRLGVWPPKFRAEGE